MIRDASATGVPLELVSGVQDNHRGLRVVELMQARGRSGYQLVPGERYLFVTKENEPPAHDERPNEDARNIAEQLWSAACAVRRKGGDQRLAAKFYNVNEKGEMHASEPCKFDVPLEELLEQGASSKDVEAVARANFLDSITKYAERLHESNATAADKHAASIERILNAQTNTIEKVANMLPRLLDLRMDAAESEVRALVSELRSAGKGSDDWKEAGKNFVEVAKGPVGAAMAAKLLGIDPKDAAAFIAQLGGGETPSATPAAATSGNLRELIAQLGSSLTDAQKATLLTGLGFDALQHLQAAQRATDEAACRDLTRKFFVALGEDDSPRWKCIESTLSDDQKVLILQAVELINPAAKA
jgi:hypothetical protein